MKKAIALILAFVLILALVACNNGSESSSSSSSRRPSHSSSSSSSEESSIESESSESESTSDSESSVESSEESSSEAVVITEEDGFSSAITKVGKSDDRMKQMAWSNTIYGKGALSSYTDDNIRSIKRKAKLVAFGLAIEYPNAKGFFSHFLDNNGEDYIIDMESFLEDENALYTRNAELNRALRACEKLAVVGEKINVYQEEELVHHNLQGDWKMALGSYFTSIEVINLTVTENTYSATFIYKVTDFYNWDENKTENFIDGFDLSQKDFAQLHREGTAKHFLSKGEISYTVSWTEGQTVSQILPFNN